MSGLVCHPIQINWGKFGVLETCHIWQLGRSSCHCGQRTGPKNTKSIFGIKQSKTAFSEWYHRVGRAKIYNFALDMKKSILAIRSFSGLNMPKLCWCWVDQCSCRKLPNLATLNFVVSKYSNFKLIKFIPLFPNKATLNESCRINRKTPHISQGHTCGGGGGGVTALAPPKFQAKGKVGSANFYEISGKISPKSKICGPKMVWIIMWIMCDALLLI